MVEEAQHAMIRFGRIGYANVWPVLVHCEHDPAIEWYEHPPTRINQLLAHGGVDMAVLSSFAYAQQAEQLYLLPGVSVSATGAVGSILLFGSIAQCPQRVAMTDASATSAHLLRLMAHHHRWEQTQFVVHPPRLETMLSTCDAALLIGDDAIRARWAYPQLPCLDLGQWWLETTGLSLTYAVWAVRRAYADAHPERIDEIVRVLYASHKKPRTAAIDRAIRVIGGDEAYWTAYFDRLEYTFEERHVVGLMHYFTQVVEQGYLPAVPTMRWWSPLSL